MHDIMIFRFIFICFLLAPCLLQAQVSSTAQEVENLLAVRQVSCGTAARFTFQAADIALDGRDDAAFAYAQSQKWLSKKAESSDPITLGQVSLLIMRSFNLKGGLIYTISHGPNHAYREMTYRKFIQGRSDPADYVSGERFLHIISRVLGVIEKDSEAKKVREAAIINTELSGTDGTSARVTSEGITISISNIQFLGNSAVLMDSERAKIREIASILERYPGRNILVGGHTALAGNVREQAETSAARAQAVADYLISLGKNRSEITVQGYGAERPIGDNNTAEGQALNRRVEITILDDTAGSSGTRISN